MFVTFNEKVKCTLVQVLRLCTGRTAHWGSRRIALLFHDQRHEKGVRGQRHAPAALSPRERPGTHCTRGWVGPRALLDRSGKPRSHRDSKPGRPAHSQSLYRLRYPAHQLLTKYLRAFTIPTQNLTFIASIFCQACSFMISSHHFTLQNMPQQTFFITLLSFPPFSYTQSPCSSYGWQGIKHSPTALCPHQAHGNI
jgi:hypothetical protein